MEKIENRIARFAIRNRIGVMILIGIISMVCGWGVNKLQLEIKLSSLIPPFHPYVKTHVEFEKKFGGTNLLVVEIKRKEGDIFNRETLEKIRRVTDAFLYHPQIMRALCDSLTMRKTKAIKGLEGGVIDVSNLMWPTVPKDKKGIERVKRTIFTNELYRGVMVSSDGKAALLFVQVKEDTDYSEFFQFLQKLRNEEEDENHSIHIAGRPILMGWIYHFLPQTNKVLWITFAIVVILVIAVFRNVIGVLFPVVVGALSTLWGLGFIGLLGITLDPLMIVLVVLVGARALSHSVQIGRRYLEEFRVSGDKLAAVEATFEGIFLPSLAGVITDMAGFLVLILARIVAIQVLAIICSIWLLSIFVLVMACLVGVTFLPTPRKPTFGFAIMDRMLKSIIQWQLNKKSAWLVVGMTAVVGCIGLYYSSHLVIGDVYPGSSILWPSSRYNQDVAEINRRFDGAGVDTMNVIVEGEEGSLETPEILRGIEDFERYAVRTFPEVIGGTRSLVPLVKKLSMEYHEGNPCWLVIPDNLKEIGSYLFLFRAKGDPQDFDQWADPAYRYGNIIMFFKDHRGETIERVTSGCEQFAMDHPLGGGKAKLRFAGGLIGILAAINQEVKWSQVGSLLLIFITVFVFCALAFRSTVAALMLVVSLIIANLVTFTYMVFKGIGLDINTLPVAAVGIGVGVDYAIYVLSRFQEEFRKSKDLAKALANGLSTSGMGVLFTAVTLIVPVVLWYFLSDLKFQAEMGLLLGFLLFFNMLGALFIIPSFVYLLKPRFIVKQKGNE